MRRVVPVLLALSLVTACRKPADSAADPALLAQVKSALAEREKKVGSYEIAGTVVQDGQQAGFEFAWRAPGRMKGTLLGEKGRTFSYDGDRLFELSQADRTLTSYELNLPDAQVRAYLTQLFASFVPEGYRAPLLDFSHAQARRVSHPKATEAVELSSETKDDAGATIRVVYVYRWPAMDLLERRLETSGSAMVIAIEEEHCVQRLGLCLPKKVAQRVGERLGAVTTLSRVDLDSTVAAEAFTLALPEGFTSKSMPLPGTGGQAIGP